MSGSEEERIPNERTQRVAPTSEALGGAAREAVGRAREAAGEAVGRTRDDADRLAESVRARPLLAMLLAAGFGYLLGRIARR